MNRSELQEQLIQQILDDMDIKTMMAVLHDYLDVDYDKYTEKELIAEVEEYYPHILEDEELTTKEIDDKLGYETYSK